MGIIRKFIEHKYIESVVMYLNTHSRQMKCSILRCYERLANERKPTTMAYKISIKTDLNGLHCVSGEPLLIIHRLIYIFYSFSVLFFLEVTLSTYRSTVFSFFFHSIESNMEIERVTQIMIPYNIRWN